MYGSNFEFDGFKSSDMNLYIVSLNNSTFTGINVSTSQDEKTNLSFDVEIAYADSNGVPLKIDDTTRRLIYSSLISADYKELVLEDYPGIVFYAKFVPVSVNLTAKREGYFKFKIETNSPYAYSEYKEYSIVNDTADEKEIIFSSYDNLNIDELYPILEFQVLDDTMKEMYVKTNREEVVFDFSDLKDYELLQVGEKITVDCETHTIYQTIDDININRIRNWNCYFLKIMNYEYLRVSPMTTLKIRYRIKTIV